MREKNKYNIYLTYCDCTDECAGQRFETEKDVTDEYDLVTAKGDKRRTVFEDEHSADHHGQCWNQAPLWGFDYVFCDLLHTHLNLFNVAIATAFHEPLKPDPMRSPEQAEKVKRIRKEVNALLKGPGTSSLGGLAFGDDSKDANSHVMNGNALNALCRGDFLSKLLKQMGPLYDDFDAPAAVQPPAQEVEVALPSLADVCAAANAKKKPATKPAAAKQLRLSKGLVNPNALARAKGAVMPKLSYFGP